MIETLEDKKLLRMMKEVEERSGDYLSGDESVELIDSLISTNVDRLRKRYYTKGVITNEKKTSSPTLRNTDL